MKQVIIVLILAVAMISCRQSEKKSETNAPIKPAEIKVVNNGNVSFDNYFLDKTMRLDYFHSGTAAEEHFAKDRIVSDGIWSGSKKSLMDDIKLGLYFFEVIDKESKILLYSRGFGVGCFSPYK